MRSKTRLGAGLFAAAIATTIAGACTWEYSTTDVTDDAALETSVDSTTEAAVDTGYVLADGRVCTGHDEDGDGVPDECDNCPNVANPDQAGGAIGTACAASTAFITDATRLLFDPFRSFTWIAAGSGAGVFAPGTDADSVVGGSTGVDLPFAVAATGAGASAVVVTTTITITEETSDNPGPGAGVLLRVSSDASRKFFLCGVSTVSGFSAQRAPDGGCSGGVCAPLTFTVPGADGGTSAAQLPLPAELPHKIGDVIGVRASATTSLGDGGILGDFECRVFDPKKPSTLLGSDPGWAVKVTAGGAKWLSSGEVGLYAQRAKAKFGSVDVLRGP